MGRQHHCRGAVHWRDGDQSSAGAGKIGRSETYDPFRTGQSKAHGSEMMRAAAIAATEVGLAIAAPIHDAFLLMAPLTSLEADVAALRAIMEATGTAVISVPVGTDIRIIRPLDRYMDERGAEMWAKVMGLLAAVEQRAAA